MVRFFSLALGYEGLNDQQTLRDGPALQVAAGKAAQEDSPLTQDDSDLFHVDIGQTFHPNHPRDNHYSNGLLGCW